MNRTVIIAEAGVNHNGDYELAKQLVRAAKEADADYVKFQTAVPELVISKYAPKAEYQLGTTRKEESQLDMCKAIHLPVEAYKSLKVYCEEMGIKFLSTPFDLVSIEVLRELDMDYFKIPSGEITNLPYLQKIARIGKPVILSTGMSGLGDIENALVVMEKEGLSRGNVILLHCNTEYPTPYEDVNLKAMLTMAQAFGTRVGYSDHTKGIEISLAAVALGACVIEKHFTLDRNMEGPDHKASLEPYELKQLVSGVRHIEKALGSPVKRVSPSEEKNKIVARKSIVAKQYIRKGEFFSAENITVKRPGNGISPMYWDEIIGRKAPEDFKEDELISL